MEQGITAFYVWPADELIKARENHARAQCRPRYRMGLKFVLLMMILAGWCNYQTQGWSILTVLLPVGGIYLLFLRKYDVRWSLRRHFRKRPDKDSHIVWTLGEDDLRNKTDNSESRQNWSQIAKVRKANNGFLLYPNDQMFYWLPTTAFVSQEDRQRTEELLRRKIKDFSDIK
jgi:hypothetical protein